MDVAQLQNSIVSLLGLAPGSPLSDPTAPRVPRPTAGAPRSKGARSTRELPSLGGIPLGRLKSLMRASQNATLLASALGVNTAPPLQLSVSIQRVYVGDQLVATGTTLDIRV